MREAYATAPQPPNQGSAKTCTQNPQKCTVSPLQAAITEIIKRRFPKGMKPWAQLCDWFDLKERAAKHRLANSASYTIEELQILIKRDDGFEILEALLEDSKPRWWSMIEQTMTLARARHHQEIARQEVLTLDSTPLLTPARRQTNRISNADRQLSDSRAAQETTLGFLLANESGPSHRALAQAKGQAQAGLRHSGGRR